MTTMTVLQEQMSRQTVKPSWWRQILGAVSASQIDKQKAAEYDNGFFVY